MKKILPFLFAISPLLGLVSCGQEEATTRVNVAFGTLIGNDAPIEGDPTSHLTWIKKSILTRLVNDKENFILLLHASADTCTCYTQWHDRVLAPYIKRNKLLVYAITLKEFESDEEYMGLQRTSGADTLAIFENGKVRYQHSTVNESDPFVTDPAAFASWMEERSSKPGIYYVNSEILDGFYAGNSPFTVYFGRDTCPDCSYLRHGLLNEYLSKNATYDKNFFYLDFDEYRPSRGDEDYDAKMEDYRAIKAKYGLVESEENPAGFADGYFPAIYYVNPDGENYTGDVIEGAGVYFNETINEETSIIGHSYFTEDRYNSASSSYLAYLKEANLENPYFEGKVAPEGNTLHDRLLPYTKPVFEALLDYAVKA